MMVPTLMAEDCIDGGHLPLSLARLFGAKGPSPTGFTTIEQFPPDMVGFLERVGNPRRDGRRPRSVSRPAHPHNGPVQVEGPGRAVEG